MKLIPFNLSLLMKSFKFRGACNWNSLPPHLKSAKTIAEFKKGVKTWIKANVTRFLD